MLRRTRNQVFKAVAVIGVAEYTTSIPSQGTSSTAYHWLVDRVGMSVLRLLDPEDAHKATIYILKHYPALAPKFRISSLEKHESSTASTIVFQNKKVQPLHLSSCIGCAAGLDKNGEVVQPLLNLGFGFVEVGSITPEPQDGNPKPRMFRLTEDRAVINRYGFNSVGLKEAEFNLMGYYDALRGKEVINDSKPAMGAIEFSQISSLLNIFQYKDQRGALGINLGKNKWRKPGVETIQDYTVGIHSLSKFADYLVINISSPNTPGLRGMQRREPMKDIIVAALDARDQLLKTENDHNKLPALFVKISPDLSDEELQDVCQVALETKIDGLIVTNTTESRPDSLLSKYKNEGGGLSGEPLCLKSTECIRKVYELTNGDIPIVGVGGISNAHDVYLKIRAGASAVQLYSMLTYEGPGLVSRIRNELASILRQQGYNSVEDIVGIDHEDLHWKKQLNRKKSILENEQVVLEP